MLDSRTDPKASLHEIFVSVQGEARLQGERQLFLRFAGCSLQCQYCDEASALSVVPQFRVEKSAGTQEFTQCKNPVYPGDLWHIVQRYRDDFSSLHSVSLTGGEPLIHARFILELIPFFKSVGLPIFLETAGVHTEQLKSLLHCLDCVSMDIKLPSTTKQEMPLQDHREFLHQLKRANVDHYVKLVVGADSSVEEMVTVGTMIKEISPDCVVYLHELWPIHPADKAPDQAKMDELIAVMQDYSANVFVSRQQHKIDKIL